MASTNAADLSRKQRERRKRRRRHRSTAVRILTSWATVWLALAGLVSATVAAALFLSLGSFRDALVDSRLDSLLVTGEIFSSAIAAGAAAPQDLDGIALDPVRLVDSARGDLIPGTEAAVHPMAYPLASEPTELLVARLAEAAGLRARVFDADGGTIADSSGAPVRRDLTRIPVVPAQPAPVPVATITEMPGWLHRLTERVDRLSGHPALPPYPTTQVLRADPFPEAVDALAGIPAAAARQAADGRIVLFAAIPIRRQQAMVGALLLETTRDEIGPLLRSEQRRVLRTFGVSAAVAVTLALLAAIAAQLPIDRLSRRTRAIRASQRPLEAPTLERRSDAVGEIARDVAAVTRRAARRIEALEAFAADVAHELKNPLTSLRSACDTLPVASTPESQAKLIDIIRHDAGRLDRLISDISAASRLDAELSLRDEARVELKDLLTAVSVVQEELAAPREQTIALTLQPPADTRNLTVRGSDTRLGEVFTNLLDNARSFTPDGGLIEVTVSLTADFVEIRIDDEGPGIKDGMAERIFERFYTDRGDAAAFGNNSGLGLSICRQIVEAYDGAIFAENRYTTSLGPDRQVLGARFVVQLPLVT